MLKRDGMELMTIVTSFVDDGVNRFDYIAFSSLINSTINATKDTLSLSMTIDLQMKKLKILVWSYTGIETVHYYLAIVV